LCAGDKHFFRSDRPPVTQAFPVVFRVFRDTVLELDSTAENARFWGVLNPSALRRRSTEAVKGCEVDPMVRY
jgi:hypothetical protein